MVGGMPPAVLVCMCHERVAAPPQIALPNTHTAALLLLFSGDLRKVYLMGTTLLILVRGCEALKGVCNASGAAVAVAYGE